VRIALVDYGAGNPTSVIKAFTSLGAEVSVARAAADLAGAAAIVVPGVGHFDATRSLDEEWRRAIGESLHRGRPLFGICLGMQWLFDGSEEAPDVAGLGLLPGLSSRLTGHVKVPHVGWNSLDVRRKDSRLLAGVADHASAYFTHSYAAPVSDDTIAATQHGVGFAAAVERGRVFGVQFHPEKSGRTGLRIVKNFLDAVSEQG